MRVRNLPALSKTQVNLADTDPLHSQPRTVAATDRSTQSLGANRHPSGCEVFRLPHPVRLVLRGVVPVLPGAAVTLNPLPEKFALSRCRRKVAPAFRYQPSGQDFSVLAPDPRVS